MVEKSATFDDSIYECFRARKGQEFLCRHQAIQEQVAQGDRPGQKQSSHPQCSVYIIGDAEPFS